MRIVLIFLFISFQSFGQVVINAPIKGGGYSAGAQAAIDNLATEPPQATKDNLATCIDCLVAAGALSEMDYLLLMAMDVQANALSNLIDGTDATLEGTTPPTFTAYVKISGTVDGYIALNFSPSTDAVNLALDDGSYSVYVVTAPTGGAADIMGGRTNAARVTLQGDGTNTRIRWGIHADDNDAYNVYNTANVSNNTYYTIKRTGSTTEVLEEDGSELHTGTNTSTELPNINLDGLGFNANGTHNNQSNVEIAAIVIGSGSINNASVNTCIEAFNSAQAP